MVTTLVYAESPVNESSVVTVMIVPGSWHSIQNGDGFDEPEGKCWSTLGLRGGTQQPDSVVN